MAEIKITRRGFFLNTGKIAIALPYLPSLLSETANAQGIVRPKRFIAFVGSSGEIGRNFFLDPRNAPATLDLTPGSYPPAFNNVPAFAALQGKWSLVHGLSLSGGGHRIEAALTSMPHVTAPDTTLKGPSFDCVLANSPGFYPGSVPFLPSLAIDGALSVRKFSGQLSRNLPPSRAALLSLFFSPNDPSVAEALKTKRKGAIDFALKDINALLNDSRLSFVDRLRLEAHVSDLRDIETTLTSDAQPQCSAPLLSNATSGAAMAEDHLKIIVRLLECDKVRAITLYSDPFGDNYWRTEKGLLEATHELSHANGAYASNHTLAVQHRLTHTSGVAQFIGSLLERLNTATDGSGQPLLNSTVVMWTNEHGCYYSASEYATQVGDLHYCATMPVMIAGAPGAFNHGKQYNTLDFYGRLFVSLFSAFGVAPSVFASSELGGFGSYEISNALSYAGFNSSMVVRLNDPIAGLVKT